MGMKKLLELLNRLDWWLWGLNNKDLLDSVGRMVDSHNKEDDIDKHLKDNKNK